MIRISHMRRQTNVYLLLVVVITIMNMVLFDYMLIVIYSNKELSYCWETARRESMPRTAEMDVEMTT